MPIFEISSVTGLNLDLLRKFLNVVPPRIQWSLLRDKPAEVLVDNDWFVQGVGTVVGGIVMSGKVTVGDTLLIGPDSTGPPPPSFLFLCQNSHTFRKVHPGRG